MRLIGPKAAIRDRRMAYKCAACGGRTNSVIRVTGLPVCASHFRVQQCRVYTYAAKVR